MTDDLEQLRAALKSAPPSPDTGRKAVDIAAAMAAFDAEKSTATQGSPAEPRLSHDRPFGRRLIDGGRTMIHTLTSRAGLAATTGLITVGLAALIVLPQQPGPQDGLRAAPPAQMEISAPEISVASADAPSVAEPVAEPAAAPQTSAPAPGEPAGPIMHLEVEATAAPSAMPVARAAPQARLAAPAADANLAADESFAPLPQAGADTEAFANKDASSVIAVADQPVSTFSVDVDTAAWSVVRSSIMGGYLPDRAAVRVEEMVNYFPYDYPAPEAGGAPFAATVDVSQTPWNPETRLLHIALQGEMPEVKDRPPLNLVFLIDTSGSMEDAAKLPLLKQSLRLMLGELRAEDQVAIVTYAGGAGVALPPTLAGEHAKILAALDGLAAGGSTAGQAGLDIAYATVAEMAAPGEVSRVLLATDGDFNVGLDDPAKLEDFIARKRESGAFLSVLGFGRGNLDDATMQALAQAGNGQAAYIDTISEAQKVLVDQLTGTLFPIAQDVKIQVEFNPAQVAEYRLIGYETRALDREDFANDKVDAGEIGAGHQVTALYEVTPVGSPAVLNEPLRYQAGDAAASHGDELGFLRLRYKEPGGAESRLIELPIPAGVSAPSNETRFASAIAGFGQLLRGSVYLGDWSYEDAAALADGARGEDRFGYRAEAVRLMRLAGTLTQAQ